MNDWVYAARSLRNHPGFTIVAGLLIALGIGANCVIFSALDAVMLKRLAAREPERLYRVVTNLPQLGKRSYMSPELYRALGERSKLASEVFGESEEFAALTEPGPAEQIRLRRVTPNYFSALGVSALYGRVLTPQDTDAAVISYRFFELRFSAGAIGRSIVVARHRYTVVGVLPKDFNGIAMDTGPEVRVPAGAFGRNDALDLSIRLKPGVTPAQALAEVSSIEKSVDPRESPVELEPLAHGISRFRDRFSAALLFLVAAVGVLLLLVCTNIAGLLLARAAARRQEIAVRLALGATRGRLIRQMLTENLLLSAIGGAGGLLIAFATTPLLERMIPPQRDLSAEITPIAFDLHPDWRVIAFSLLLCAATALLCGLAPAWAASRSALHDVLRSARASAGWRGRQALMTIQVALCMVLLAAAGLLIRTFERLNHQDAGFDREHIVTFTVNPELAGETPQQADSIKRSWIARVRALPGVTSAAFAAHALMRGSGIKSSTGFDGQRLDPGEFMNTSMNTVSPEYFETMGIRFVEGRTFQPSDETREPKPVIVNEAFVRHIFSNQDALGKKVGHAARGATVRATEEIIGVVTDAKYRSLREPDPPVEYWFDWQPSNDRFILHVRTVARPDSIIGPVREALRSLDPGLPIVETHTLAEEISDSIWSERLIATLASAFAALAAIVTAVGFYGLIAYLVTQGTREIGIRMALGARPPDITRAIAMPALRMMITGVLAGVGTSLILAPTGRALLYEIAPTDSISLFLSVSLLLLAACVAVMVPLVRALRIDPAIALRVNT